MTPQPLLLVRPELMSRYERQFAARHFRIEESRMLCQNSLVVGRYSVLPCYEELDRDLRLIGSRLVNTVDEHNWISTFAYYEEVKDFTPKTWDESNIHLCDHEGKFVVKGKRSSKKWDWKTRMFAESKAAALKLGEWLKEDLEIAEQGIVYRQFVPLKTFEIGRNGLPYTNEWRLFFLGTCLLDAGYYWSVGDCLSKATLSQGCLRLAQHIAEIVARFATFYTLDLAETEAGDWILIEINDGQTAVPSEHDLDKLYASLKEEILKQ